MFSLRPHQLTLFVVEVVLSTDAGPSWFRAVDTKWRQIEMCYICLTQLAHVHTHTHCFSVLGFWYLLLQTLQSFCRPLGNM